MLPKQQLAASTCHSSLGRLSSGKLLSRPSLVLSPRLALESKKRAKR